MKKELVITIAIVVFGWVGSFAYSYGVTHNKIENITQNVVTTADFSAQQERINNLVVTVNRVVSKLDRLIEMMIQDRK